jgi:hypothetical protein
MKYYKVKTGFKDDDFISVDENELPMAIRAQVTGKIGIFKEGTVTGDKIITITADWNKELGYNRTYQMSAEDYGELPKSLINEYRELLENTTLQITGGDRPETKNLPPSQFSKELSDKFKIK